MGIFVLLVQAVQRFVVADLSNWYLDVIKDRLYVSADDSFDRRAAQTVLHSLVQARHTMPLPNLIPRWLLTLCEQYPQYELCFPCP